MSALNHTLTMADRHCGYHPSMRAVLPEPQLSRAGTKSRTLQKCAIRDIGREKNVKNAHAATVVPCVGVDYGPTRRRHLNIQTTLRVGVAELCGSRRGEPYVRLRTAGLASRQPGSAEELRRCGRRPFVCVHNTQSILGFHSSMAQRRYRDGPCCMAHEVSA